MMRRWTRVLVIGGACLLAGCGGRESAGRSFSLEFAPRAGATVGTYDSRAVALAWGRSAEHQRLLEARMAAHAEAERTGDAAEAKRIADELQARQDRLHGQVFGDEAIPDILEQLAERLPAIKSAAGVERLVSSKDYGGRAEEAVDVTPLVVREFDPDEKTLGFIGQLQGHPPVKGPYDGR